MANYTNNAKMADCHNLEKRKLIYTTRFMFNKILLYTRIKEYFMHKVIPHIHDV